VKALSKKVQVINNKIQALKRTIESNLKTFGDNPNIRRISENCFTLKINQLGKNLNLSALHYDFLKQYSILINIVEKTPFEKLEEVLGEIIKKGTYYTSIQGRVVFHKTVITNLKKVLEKDLDLAHS